MPAVGAGDGRVDLTQTRPFSEVKKGYTPFKEGDVLFAKITPCMENGKIAVAPALANGLGFGSTEFHVLRPYLGISARYLYYFLSRRKFRDEAERNMTGAVGQRRVPTAYLSERCIPIPPAPEQTRIVLKISELFSEIDKGVEYLSSALVQLAAYRYSILKHAFEGSLTDDWRLRNHTLLEDRDALSSRLRRDQDVRYTNELEAWQRALARWRTEGQIARKPSKPTQPAAIELLADDDLQELPALPEGWAYVRLGGLIDEPAYGTSKRCTYAADGVGVLRIPNIIHGAINVADLKFAKFDEAEVETYRLLDGDILTIRSNGSVSIVGQSALVSKQEERYLFAGYLIRLRSHPDAIRSRYLLAALSTHFLRSQIERKAKSTSGVNNINSAELQSLVVPLCGLGEQDVLLDRLSAALSSIDATEAEIRTQLDRADALRQSILNEAFCGRLSVQNISDEPASSLLERIKREVQSKREARDSGTFKQREIA
jgi:type I restriction enzyme S subunit